MSGILHSEFPCPVVLGLGLKTGLPLWSNIHKNITFTTSPNIRFYEIVVTACKRSLGQGNIFSNVCQEFCPRGGGSGPGGAWSRGVRDPRGGVWSWGVPGPGGCLIQWGAWSRGVWSWGLSVWRPHSQWLLLRAVHILRECIFVTSALKSRKSM